MKIKILLISTVMLLTACSSSQNSSTGDILSVAITIDNLPDTFTYNKPSTPDGRVEYKWGVTFDITGDGAINQGDIILQILQFKLPGSIEKTGAINDFEVELWVYETDTSITSPAKGVLQITGNTITLSINKSAHPSLASITESTLVYFESSTYDSTLSASVYDYHPASFTLMSIPVDANFTDPQSDTYPPVSASHRYIDILNMSIFL